MRSVFYRISYLETIVKDMNEPARTDLFERVKAFIMSGCYTSYKKADKFIKYSSMTDSDLANKLGTTIANVRQVRSRISHEAYDMLGEDILNTLEFGDLKNVKSAARDFCVIEKCIDTDDIILPDIMRLLKEYQADNETFDIGDCKYELTLLHWLTTKKIKSLMSNVDLARLGYLLRVLNGEEGTSTDRAKIIRVILADDLVSHVKADDKKKFSFPPVRPDDEF